MKEVRERGVEGRREEGRKRVQQGVVADQILLS